MKGSSRRFRDFVLALDLGAAVGVVALLLGVLFFIYSFFSMQYFAARRQDADKTCLILEEHLEQAQQELRFFVELSEPERAGVNRQFLRSFSDLYRLNKDLRVERIYTAVQQNRLFPGYSFAQGRLGRYLKEESQEQGFSEIMVGLEDEKPSIYCSIKTPQEQFLARVEISYLTALLGKMTQFSGMPILLLARDGFVVTSTAPELGISTLSPHLSDTKRQSLYAGGNRWMPLFSESNTAGVTVALLIPLQVMELLRNILLFSALLCVVALGVMTLFKRRLTDRLMLAPLSAFADRLGQFSTIDMADAAPAVPYRFEELSLLDSRLTEMTQTIAEREEGLRSALAQLQESRRFIIQAVDNAHESFGWLTPDGVLQYANATSLAVIGKKAAEVIGFPLWETPWFSHDPLEAQRLRKAIHHAAAGETIRYETIHVKTDGARREVDFSLHPIFDATGAISMLVAEGRDITDQREAVRQREKITDQFHQVQKMESVGRLAGGVAHDFNNMLSVILGHAELALKEFPVGHPLRSDLEQIQKAAIRSADLTRQLLAFARKQTVAPKVLDLNETVEGMLKMLRRLIGEDIDLAWLPSNSLGAVKIDPSQIDQILANLCVNARDAIGGKGGKVTIETGRGRFDTEYCETNAGFIPGEYVMLAVSDDGCGMDPETLELIFEPFFTTKNVGEGTGLGLSTVYGIVKQNGGFINVYSEPGLGTTFRIYLPRHSDEVVPIQKEDTVKQTVYGHETILLVEDEPAILNMTTTVLDQLRYTVLPAAKPSEAIRLAGEYAGEIHLLMTDVIMPEMNGRDLAAKLLSLYPGLKRLFMSGYTANVIAHHGVLDDGVYFIQKPFTTKDLSLKIREVLDQG